MTNKPKILIGTSGWSYPHWYKTFYPEDIPKSHWFQYYTAKFATVEINACFYRAFPDQTYQKWYQNSPADFKYVLKAHRIITHRKLLLNVTKEIERCWQSAILLKEKLGLILLQLPPKFPFDLERLHKALLQFPERNKVAVEFRDPKWFSQEVQNLLSELGVTICNSDSPTIELKSQLTSDTGYIRLHGVSSWYDSCYSNKDLQKIAKIIKKMGKNGAKQIYIFFNNDSNGYAPKNAIQLQKILDD